MDDGKKDIVKITISEDEHKLIMDAANIIRPKFDDTLKKMADNLQRMARDARNGADVEGALRSCYDTLMKKRKEFTTKYRENTNDFINIKNLILESVEIGDDPEKTADKVGEYIVTNMFLEMFSRALDDIQPGLYEEIFIKRRKRKLPQIQTKSASMLDLSTDRVNRKLMEDILHDESFAKGQHKYTAAYIDKKPIPVKVSLQMDEDEIQKLGVKHTITSKDKLIMEAISTIYNADTTPRTPSGDKVVYCTENALWAQMGARSTLNGRNIDLLEKELQKLATSWVELDTSRLLKEYTENGDTGRKVKIKNVYKGNLLHVDIRQTGIVDGKECVSLIKIYADPILMEYARDLGEVTSIPLYVAQATGSLTDDNLAIADYLQHQIAWMRHSGTRHPIITIDHLKEKTNTKKRDKALKKYVEELLSGYATPPKDKEPAWIKGFKPVTRGYEIILSAPPKEPKSEKYIKTTTRKKKKP